MTSIELLYNPYTRGKILFVDGGEVQKDECEKLCGAEGTELSEWAEHFLNACIEHFNDSISVSFSGIRRDHEFLEDAVKKSKYSSDISLSEKKIVDAENRLQELKNLFAEMQENTPFESLKSAEVKRLFEKATDSEFEMAVVATMSSGKSTLINSILGRELLPAKNEATTANIARIHDIDDTDHFRAESFDKDGNKIGEVDPLTAEDMERLNNIDGENPASVVEIYGDIPGIESKNIRLVLSDTPGTNNSCTAEHEKHTMDLLNADYKPMIIYVLNATQLETNDDNNLLSNVARLVKSGDRQSRDRFLFVLNKADEFDPDKAETVARKIDDVKRYLFDKHGIENPRVFPTSARLAKGIRQSHNNDPKFTAKDKRNLSKDRGDFVDERMHFSDYADFLSPATFNELKSRIERAKSENDEDELALLYSGVPSIELAISEYLSKYALPAKITEGVYSFKDKIEALNIEANAKNELAGNEQKVQELKKNLEMIKATLENGDKAQEVKLQIQSLSVCDRLNKELAKSGSKLLSNFGMNVQSMKKSVHTETARAYLNNIKMMIPKITADFNSSVEKSLDGVLKAQAAQCVERYKRYLEALIGSVSYDIPAAAILGDKATITVSETLDEYSYEEDVKVGSHKEENSGFRAGVARFLGFSSFFGRSGYRDVSDYEKQEFVDFSKYIDNELYPKIEKFEKETRTTATSWAEAEEKKFKQFFLNKLNELDEAIKQKIAEQEAALKNKAKTEEMIAENKRNLSWLEDFKSKLDGILSI